MSEFTNMGSKDKNFDKQMLRISNSATTLELINNGLSRNNKKSKESLLESTKDIQYRTNDEVERLVKAYESPLPNSDNKIMQSPGDNASDSDIASMHQQFESIYASQEEDMRSDVAKTQDSKIPTGKSKPLKKKLLRKKNGQKSNLNLKTN
jgi:hypothetical protein